MIIHDDENQSEALRQLVRWASDPELEFTWYCAAKMAQQIRSSACQDAADGVE